MKRLFWMTGLLAALVIPVAAQNTHAKSVVRMNRDCGIAGSGDETGALNTCIANLPNYSTLECDRPMTISTTGIVVNGKVGVVIKTGAGHHAVDEGNNYCKISYTGSAGGTAVDWDRVRDSKLQGFAIVMNDADKGIWIRQNGAGGGISTADTFEGVLVANNHARSTATGYYLGDPSGSNCDEMTFRRAIYSGDTSTPSGTAFYSSNSNVKGTRFEDVQLIGANVGWDWAGYADYTVSKGNGYAIGTLYYRQAPAVITQDDYEQVGMVADIGPTGDGGYSALRARYNICSPTYVDYGGGGVICKWLTNDTATGMPGYPAFKVTGGMFIDTTNVKIDRGFDQGTLVACTTNCANTSYRGFADPGAITFANFNYNPASALSREFSTWTGAGATGIGSSWAGWNLIDSQGGGVRGIGSNAENVGGSFSGLCIAGNLCIGDGQAEFTGVHSVLSTPATIYTGAAGPTDRDYAVMACSANPCSIGTRALISPRGNRIHSTQASLDGSNYVTLTWPRAIGAVSYSILQGSIAANTDYNELMTGITCSTNPCTVNVTTESSTYTYVVPTYNETGGAILRGAIKMGKSAKQAAVVDFTFATVAGFAAANLSNGTTGSAGTAVVLAASPMINAPAITGNMTYANTAPVANLTAIPLTYNHTGTQQTAAHLVVDSCRLGTDCSVTLTGAAVFSSASSYTCTCQDETTIASCKVVQSSGSAFTITGNGTDTIRYSCAGN